jgi:hypothetical protein
VVRDRFALELVTVKVDHMDLEAMQFFVGGGSYQHTLDVDVYSYPSNEWAVYCTRFGNTVPGAQFTCGKAHTRLS